LYEVSVLQPPVAKRSGREVHHSRPCSAEVKSMWS